MRKLGSLMAFLPVVALAMQGGACGGGNDTNGNGDDGGAGSSGGGSSGAGSSGAGSSGAGSSGASSSSGSGSSGAGDAGDGGNPNAGPSVLEFHRNKNRDGFYVDAALKKSAISTMHLDANFKATTSGQTYSQVLFMEGGVNGKDALFVATENNDVFALDPMTGAQLWKQSIGQNVGAGALQCGDINPIGSTGTPVIDAASRTLYVDGIVNTNGMPRHTVAALSVDTGKVTWTLDLDATIGNGFDTTITSVRSALGLLAGKVWVAGGGYDGDCGSYKGWVIGIPQNNPQSAKGWSTAAPSGPGIWGPSGIASDGTSIFVATGNTNNHPVARPTVWSQANSEAIIKLSTAPAFSGNAADYHAQKLWLQMDQGDADLGSSGVVVFDAPMSTPSKLAFAVGKTGMARVVDRTNMGGISDGLSNVNGLGGGVFGPMFAYTTAKGTYVGFHQSVTGCNGGDFSVLKLSKTAQLSFAWCGSGGGPGGPISSSTSADGSTDSTVWSFGSGGDGILRAWDGDTGMKLFTSAAGAGGPVQHWTSPIIAKGRVYIAGDGAVYAFTL